MMPDGDGCLYALEVDVAEAVDEFKDLVRGFAQTSGGGAGGSGGTGGDLLGQLQLDDFADVLDTAPPGLDELVALSRVLKLVQKGGGGTSGSDVKFDRIVIDTAPTGHTLRLLALPQFLDGFVDRLVGLGNRNFTH